jgi:hypothetical protein
LDLLSPDGRMTIQQRGADRGSGISLIILSRNKNIGGR